MTDMLNLSRLYNAVASVAGMRRAVVEALAWSRQRVAFGTPVIAHTLMTEQLFDLACAQRVSLHWAFRGWRCWTRSTAGARAKKSGARCGSSPRC